MNRERISNLASLLNLNPNETARLEEETNMITGENEQTLNFDESIPLIRRGYPTENTVIIEDRKYKRGVLSALRKFKREKTFKKTMGERLVAMRTLVNELVEVYELKPITIDFIIDSDDWEEKLSSDFEENLGNGQWIHSDRQIRLKGKLSIITLLHEFAHARFDHDINNGDERITVKWSINLFRRVYPKQFERLNRHGHVFSRG